MPQKSKMFYLQICLSAKLKFARIQRYPTSFSYYTTKISPHPPTLWTSQTTDLISRSWRLVRCLKWSCNCYFPYQILRVCSPWGEHTFCYTVNITDAPFITIVKLLYLYYAKWWHGGVWCGFGWFLWFCLWLSLWRWGCWRVAGYLGWQGIISVGYLGNNKTLKARGRLST